MTSLRLIRAGSVSPVRLHALYTGLAEAQDAGSDPLLVLAHSDSPHLSIGASQFAAAELDLEACRRQDVAIVQRWLGGGTVWVDPDQLCLFLILPPRHAPLRPTGLFEQGTALIERVYHACGLSVARQGERDLVCAGRKIGGSGAGRIGHANVFASSFLYRFPAARFAKCIAGTRPGFQDALLTLLRRHMTDWVKQAEPPDYAELAATISEVAAAVTGWAVTDSHPGPAEEAAMAEAEDELSQPLESGSRRLIPGGVKIRHGVYLQEGEIAGQRVRVTLEEGRIRAVTPLDEALPEGVAACLDEEPEAERLERRLQGAMPPGAAADWAQGLAALTGNARERP